MTDSLFQIQRLLSEISPAEKIQLLEWVVADLGESSRGIEATAGVCGGDPRVVRTRIPVWLLERARRGGIDDAELLRCYPTLRSEDLANAWAYVAKHAAEIDAQIAANEDA